MQIKSRFLSENMQPRVAIVTSVEVILEFGLFFLFFARDFLMIIDSSSKLQEFIHILSTLSILRQR